MVFGKRAETRFWPSKINRGKNKNRKEAKSETEK